MKNPFYARILLWVATILVMTSGTAAHPLFGQSETSTLANATADAYDAAVPITWFQLTQQLVKETPGYSPPVAARAFGYLGVTLYEAVTPGMPGYQSLAGQVNELKAIPLVSPGQERHWPTVANAALAEITRDLFPTASEANRAAIETLEEQFVQQFAAEIPQEVLVQSQAHGWALARHIFKWSKSDGGHEAYLAGQRADYSPPIGEGLWTPTLPNFGRALQPHWGENRPFVLQAGDVCAPPPPPIFSSASNSLIYDEGLEVYQTVKALTPEQRQIALFWADNPGETSTPPGHSLAIATQVLQQEKASLALAAITYSKMGMAVADAFIGCWKVKYTYNRLRPITYIQQIIDPGWNANGLTDPVVTPPFPAYTSGHATQSGAAMTVLSALFGEQYPFTDAIHVSRSYAPRSYYSFMDAAEEAALSRLYGGIHFRSDNEAGLRQGICIGEKVNELKYRK